MKDLIPLPYTVKITREEVLKQTEFINKRVEKDALLYKRRGAFKISDIIVGVASEIATYKALNNQYDMLPPDFKIYDKKNKSYGADLTDKKGRHFHVKSQTISSMKKYGPSWLFSKYDPIFKDQKQDEYLIFCGCTLKEQVTLMSLPQEFEVDILAIAKIGHLNDLLNDESRTQAAVHQLRNSKRAIYLQDVWEEMDEWWKKNS